MTNIQIRTGGHFWTISVDGKTTDIGVKVTDHYRVYKRDGDCGLALADKLGAIIGCRIVQTPKNDRQTTEADLRTAIAMVC